MRGSIRTRLLAAFIAVALAAAAGMSLYFLTELEAFALRKLEDRMSTEAAIVAALIAPVYEQAQASGPGSLGDAEAALLGGALERVGPEVSSRIRVLDGAGRAVADSAGDAGVAYAERPEVRAALRGGYGAATRIMPDGRVELYVATPVTVAGKVAGAAYVSSTTFSIRTLLQAYRVKLALVVLAFVAGAFVIAEVLARWLSRPLRDLESAAQRLPSDHSVRVEPSGSRETHALALAFNDMAAEVETVVTELRAEEARKSRFVSDVSHELRTPLTAIRGAAETLAEGDVPDRDAQRFLATIVSEAERLSRLAHDLVSLQRIEGGTGELPLARIDLARIAVRAVNALEPLLADRGVSVEVTGAAPEVLGDPDRLQQVFANLVENASRVSAAGSSVTVTLSGDGRHAVAQVVDSGPGVPAADLPNLFDRFYRAEPSRDRGTGGFGLGLSIVKAIVEAHGGDVTAANGPQAGLTVTMRLPALERLGD